MMSEELRRMEELALEELRKINEKGFNVQTLDHAYKLIDIVKDIKETEKNCAEIEEMEGESEYSGARQRRDRMGRYTRDRGNYDRMSRDNGRSYRSGDWDMDNSYADYMDNKRSYRYSGDAGCKQRMMDTLDKYMDSFERKMEEMLSDTDCAEEKETINRYIRKLKEFK